MAVCDFLPPFSSALCMAFDNNRLCIGLIVEDEIQNSVGLSATNTFVTLSPTFMQVGPVDLMSPKIEEQVMARTNVEIWVNEDALAKHDIQPIKTPSHDMLRRNRRSMSTIYCMVL